MSERVDTPTCKATREELLQGRQELTVYDECPACLDFNVRCRIACHPSSTGIVMRIIYFAQVHICSHVVIDRLFSHSQ